MGRPISPPQPQPQPLPNVGNQLADLDPDQLRPDQKREGVDWFAVFNPRIRRVLDVDLVHNLTHESVVCCVRFSFDGRYVATGCNRSAQIFDVSTGQLVTKLQDESVDKDGDLYIRSVCFSPDGKYLATGAEDKQIRVSCLLHFSRVAGCSGWIRTDHPSQRSGIFQRAPSDIHSPAMSKTYIRLTSPAMENILRLAAVIVPSVCGISKTDGKS